MMYVLKNLWTITVMVGFPALIIYSGVQGIKWGLRKLGIIKKPAKDGLIKRIYNKAKARKEKKKQKQGLFSKFKGFVKKCTFDEDVTVDETSKESKEKEKQEEIKTNSTDTKKENVSPKQNKNTSMYSPFFGFEPSICTKETKDTLNKLNNTGKIKKESKNEKVKSDVSSDKKEELKTAKEEVKTNVTDTKKETVSPKQTKNTSMYSPFFGFEPSNGTKESLYNTEINKKESKNEEVKTIISNTDDKVKTIVKPEIKKEQPVVTVDLEKYNEKQEQLKQEYFKKLNISSDFKLNEPLILPLNMECSSSIVKLLNGYTLNEIPDFNRDYNPEKIITNNENNHNKTKKYIPECLITKTI